MSNGIAHNNLNDISKIYLDTISDINKKEQEDDVKRWQQEESECGQNTRQQSPFKKKKVKAYKEAFSNWRKDLREVTSDAEAVEVDDQPEIKEKKVKNKIKINPEFKEAVSEIEVSEGKGAGTVVKQLVRIGAKKLKSKKVKKAIYKTVKKIGTAGVEGAVDAATDRAREEGGRIVKDAGKKKKNSDLEEAVKQMGGELLEVTEVDDKDDKKKEQDAAAAKKSADKEKKLKLRILRVKMMAAKSDSGASITAGYEPDIDGAVEYFYEEGINEEGLEQLVEEIGLEAFVDFIEGGTVELNEERSARRATVRAKKYDVVKKEVDKADAARKKSKKGEYAPSYAKKETDVTVYDDKPSAKKKAAPAKKATAPKKPVAPKKPAAPKKPVTKKVVKAVAKVKKSQPAKKPSKPGIRDKIATLYKRGVKRHRKATQAPRVFAKGVKSGAKKAVKFVKDVHKAVNEEELKERLGGKGYQPYTSLTGKKVSGDWEDSDRGAGNKAKKRAGGKVEKKSPTYLAHVHNKEGYQRDPEQSKKDRTHSKQPDPSKDGFTGIGNMSIKDIMKMNAKMKKKKEVKEDKAFNYVLDKLRKKHGKDAVITKTSKQKPPTEEQKKKAAAERKKRQDADNKAYTARARKAGYKNTQDYTDVVARYGSEDNYKKGKGLGT